jgi:predicted GTPase
MSDEITRNFIQALQKMIQDTTQKEFVFFVVGRTGWGKSSTINSLVGKYVSPVSDRDPETADVIGFPFEINGVKATVFDTPGFCDGTGNDETYINMIESKVKNPDSMLYVSRLDEPRRIDDNRVVKIITEALDPSVWEHAVIVFTCANSFSDIASYKKKLNTRTQDVKEALAQHLSNTKVVEEIPVVAIDNKSKRTLDGEEWRGKLFTAVVEQASKEGTIALLGMLTPIYQNILNKKQKEIIRKKFVESVFQSTAAATGIGVAVAGFVGVPIILGFSSAGMIGTIIGAWLSKED